MGSQRVRQDWATNTFVFCPGGIGFLLILDTQVPRLMGSTAAHALPCSKGVQKRQIMSCPSKLPPGGTHTIGWDRFYGHTLIQREKDMQSCCEPRLVDGLVAKLCLILCGLMPCSPPGSSVLGIFQARILKWVASSFSRGSSTPRDWTWVFCIAGRFLTNWAIREAF